MRSYNSENCDQDSDVAKTSLAEKCASNARKREYGVIDAQFRRHAPRARVSQKRFGHTLTINFSERHHDGLLELARRTGTTASELIRLAVNRVYFADLPENRAK
jgi:hypothetical protein